jgi:hypothetical protein
MDAWRRDICVNRIPVGYEAKNDMFLLLLSFFPFFKLFYLFLLDTLNIFLLFVGNTGFGGSTGRSSAVSATFFQSVLDQVQVLYQVGCVGISFFSRGWWLLISFCHIHIWTLLFVLMYMQPMADINSPSVIIILSFQVQFWHRLLFRLGGYMTCPIPVDVHLRQVTFAFQCYLMPFQLLPNAIS